MTDEGSEIQHHRQQTGEHICHRLGNNHAIIAPNAAQCPNDKTVDHALTANGQHEGAHRLAVAWKTQVVTRVKA